AALKNAPITRVNDPNTVLGQATHTLVSPTKGTGDTTHSVKPATESSLVDGTPVVHSVTDLPAKDSEGRSITYKDSKGNEINTEQLQKLTPQEITSLKLTANVVDNSGTSVTIAKVRFAEDGQGNMQAKVKMDKDNATVAGADVPKTTADGQLLYKVGTVDNGEHSHPIATSEMTIQEIQKLVSEPVPIFQNGVKVGEAHYVDPIVNGVLDPARLENGALKLNTTVKGGAVKSTLATEYKVNAKKVELPTTDSYGKQVTYTVTDSDGVTKPFTKDDLVKMSPTDLIKKPLNITQVDSSGHKVDIEFSTTDGGKTITVKTAGEDSRPAPESVMVHARNEKGQKLYTVEVEPSASGNTHAPITEQVTASDFAEGGKYSKLDVMKGDTKISEVSHQVTETTAGAVLDHKGDEVGAAPTTPTVNRPTEVQSTEDAGHHVIVKLPEINTDTGKPVRYEIKNANGEVVAQSKLTDGTLSPDEAHGLVIKQIDTESGKAIGTMTLAKTGTGNDVAVDGTKTVLDPDALSLGTKHASDEGGNKLYDVTLPESYKPSGELKAKLDAMGFVPGQKMTMTEGQIQHVFGVTEDSLIQTKNAKVASAKEDLDKAQSDYEVTIKTAALKQAIQEANHAIAMSKPTVMQMGADKSGHPTTVRLSVTTADGGEINLSAELHDTNPNHLPERSVKPGEKFTATDPATGRTVEVVVQKNGAFKIQKSVGQSIKDTAASIFNKKSEYLKNLANLPNEAAGGLQHLLTDQRNLPDSIFSNQRGMNAQDRAISGAVATVKKYDAAKKALQKADDALVNSHIVVLDGDPVAQAKLQKLQNAVASAKAQVEKRAAQKDVAQAIINAARTPAYNGWTFTDASGKTFTGAVQHNDDGTLSHFSLIPEASSAVTPKGTTAVPPSKSPAKTSALPGSSGGNPEELPQPKAAAVAPQEEGGMFNNKVGPASDGVLPVVKKPSFLQKIFSKTNRVGVEATVSDAQAPVTTASSSPEVSSSPAATNKAIARATADQIRQQGAWNNNASDVVMKVAADSLGQTVKIEDVAGNTPAAHTTFMPSSTSDANPNTGAPLTLKRVMVIDPDGHQSPHYIAVVNGLDVPIRADGDCLYRALIVLRNGLSSDNDVTSEQIQALRDQIATTIERSPEAYAPFITPDILGNGGSPPPKL
ncbi:MAG: hypothetical protein IT497_06140, partial [Ottowia sp.]|nr:hypothetical protein [Ottowia sp.]